MSSISRAGVRSGAFALVLMWRMQRAVIAAGRVHAEFPAASYDRRKSVCGPGGLTAASGGPPRRTSIGISFARNQEPESAGRWAGLQDHACLHSHFHPDVCWLAVFQAKDAAGNEASDPPAGTASNHRHPSRELSLELRFSNRRVRRPSLRMQFRHRPNRRRLSRMNCTTFSFPIAAPR